MGIEQNVLLHSQSTKKKSVVAKMMWAKRFCFEIATKKFSSCFSDLVEGSGSLQFLNSFASSATRSCIKVRSIQKTKPPKCFQQTLETIPITITGFVVVGSPSKASKSATNFVTVVVKFVSSA